MFQVTMLLASAPGQPDGSVHDRLVLNLALTRLGEIDEAEFLDDSEPWAGRRETPDGQIRRVELVRLDEGWALSGEHDEDSPVWRLTARLFRPGEYVSAQTQRDAELVYRIVSVERLW